MTNKVRILSDSLVTKLILSVIIPGGFIAWGLYELHKRKTNKRSTDEDDINTR